LKKYFILAQVLCHFNPERKIVVETDISNLVIAGALPPYDDKGILYSVAYFSRKHSSVKINHEIYNKEPLMIIHVIKE
jgi:hypothetical protein